LTLLFFPFDTSLQHRFYIIPDNKVLVYKPDGLVIFNIPPLVAGRRGPIDPPFHMAWPASKHSFPKSYQLGISPPHSDEHFTRIAVLCCDGVYGITIPRFIHGIPPCELMPIQLSRFTPSIDLSVIGCARIGINKAYIWPEGDQGYALTYVWPDRNTIRPNASEVARHMDIHSPRSPHISSMRSTPYGWGYKWDSMMMAPHMDEMSGRLLAPVRQRGWGLIELQ